MLLFLLGAIANTLVYWSIAPFVVFMIMLAASLAAARLLGKDTSEERTAIWIIFITCWFWAAVSANQVHVVTFDSPGGDLAKAARRLDR